MKYIKLSKNQQEQMEKTLKIIQLKNVLIDSKEASSLGLDYGLHGYWREQILPLIWKVGKQENSSDLYITGIYKLSHNSFVENKEKINMEIAKLKLAAGERPKHAKSTEYWTNLYKYLQSMKSLSGRQAKETAIFQNQRLLDIAESIVVILNRKQQSCDKQYMSALCIFVRIISIRNYTTFMYRIRQQFFQNLPSILRSLIQKWNQHTDKSNSIKPQLVAFLRNIIGLSEKKTSYCYKIYNKQMLETMSLFEFPNDEILLKLFCRMVLNGQKARKEQKRQFAIKICKSLKYANFPIKMIPKCLEYVMSWTSKACMSDDQQQQVLTNLKRMLRQNFKKRTGFINLSFVVFFIGQFFKTNNELSFDFPELQSYCQIVQNYQPETMTKVSIIKAITMNIMFTKNEFNQEQLDQIALLANTAVGLTVLHDVFIRISSAGLIKLVQSNILCRLLELAKQSETCKHDRMLALKALRCVIQRMHGTNINIFNYLKISLECIWQMLKQTDVVSPIGLQQNWFRFQNLCDLQFSYI